MGTSAAHILPPELFAWRTMPPRGTVRYTRAARALRHCAPVFTRGAGPLGVGAQARVLKTTAAHGGSWPCRSLALPPSATCRSRRPRRARSLGHRPTKAPIASDHRLVDLAAVQPPGQSDQNDGAEGTRDGCLRQPQALPGHGEQDHVHGRFASTACHPLAARTRMHDAVVSHHSRTRSRSLVARALPTFPKITAEIRERVMNGLERELNTSGPPRRGRRPPRLHDRASRPVGA